MATKMTSFNKFKPSVTAPLEEWDDTTDVIMWVIEQSEIYHLTGPKLELDEQPTQRYNRSSFDILESQSATLTGYTKEHYKAKYNFYADVIQIKIPEPDSDSGFAEVDGYEILIEKEDPATYRMKTVERFTIKGYDRSTFERLQVLEVV